MPPQNNAFWFQIKWSWSHVVQWRIHWLFYAQSYIQCQCSCVVCVHRVYGVGTEMGDVPAFFTARAARLSGTGPGGEACEEFAEMSRSTMVRAIRWVLSHSFIPPPLSHLSSWPSYSLAIFYFSTLFIPLFYPTFNAQPHPHVSHDACFLFSFLKNLLLEEIATTSITVSTKTYG